MRVRLLLTLTALSAVPAVAQSEYGGGWAVPSLDTSISIANDVIRSEIVTEIGLRSIGRDKQGRPLNGQVAGSPVSKAGAPAVSESRSLFEHALKPLASADHAMVQTRFTRTAMLQKQSESKILAEVKRRQPGAEAEYARVFATRDMAALFGKATAPYGLRNDDVADTMAAYWLVSWVIANDAKDFSTSAARAVREQVKRGISQTAVANASSDKRHLLADEAIFNTLIATQAFEYAQSGKISKADYRRLADVTQKSFVGFGVNLRALQLTDAGFRER